MAYGYGLNQQVGLNTANQNIQPNNSTIVQNSQNVQPLFPQPQGNVYYINSTLEVANVPVGAGVSVAICLPENVMYMKTMQNGNPLFYPYRIMPLNGETTSEKAEEKTEDEVQQQLEIINSLVSQIKNCNNRIADLEEQIQKIIKHQKKGSDWDI